MQTTLRTLADLVRRRRWEAAQAVAVPAHRMVVSTELGHVAVSGEGTYARTERSTARSCGIRRCSPSCCGRRPIAEELFADVALENDPSPSRAHASWHGCAAPVATAGAPLEIRAGMLLRDTTAAGPRLVCQYAVLVAVVGFLFTAFSPPARGRSTPPTGSGCSGSGTPMRSSGSLLVPGFLYTRLGLSDRRSISGRLRRCRGRRTCASRS